jgi:YndJ-like protein
VTVAQQPVRSNFALAIGLIAWLAGLIILPAPFAARIMLLAPLVIVPRLLGLLPARGWVPRLSGWPALVAALALLASFAVPAGAIAAALAAPWLLICGAAALAAALDGLPRLPGLLDPARAAELGVDVSMGFLAVGAAFATMDRLGVAPMGFSATVIPLTATHFHFAGFGLLGLATLLAARRPALRAPVIGLIVGMPITALGFIVPSPVLGAVGALFVGLSGIAFALSLLVHAGEAANRWGYRVAATALLVGMPMGIAWSLAMLFQIGFLDLDTMIRSHGALNATAVLVVTAAYHEATT